MRTTTRTAVTATLLAATILLTGCASTGTTDVFIGAGKADASATATASPAPTVIPGDENDDGKLSEFEKQVHGKKTPRDYTLPDGTIVNVDPTVPLPQPVLDAVYAAAKPKADEIAAVSSRNGVRTGELIPELHDILAEQSALTGRNIVGIFRANGADGRTWLAEPSGESAMTVRGSQNQAQHRADVQAWADERGYDVIVLH